MSPERERRTGSQAVERALTLLRSFEVGPPTRSLSELAHAFFGPYAVPDFSSRTG